MRWIFFFFIYHNKKFTNTVYNEKRPFDYFDPNKRCLWWGKRVTKKKNIN